MALFDFLKKKPFEPETFSGTEEFLHVNTMDQPLTEFKSERPGRGHGESVLGDALYMSDKTDRKWFAPQTSLGQFMVGESGKPEGVYKIKTKFKNALVVTPQNIDAIESNLLSDLYGLEGLEGNTEIRQRLQELGYDGLISKGFDELPQSYYNRQFGLRESPLARITQDQVLAFDPAEAVQNIKEVNPRDYHKSLLTRSEEKAIERRTKNKKGIVYGVPGVDQTFNDLEEAKLALEDGSITQEEYDSLKPRKGESYDTETSKRLKESVLSRTPEVPWEGAGKIGPSFGKALGLAGLGLAFTDAKKVYAQGMEQDMGPVISSLAAGGKFAYDTIAPAFTMIFDSPNVGEGSDVIPEGEMFIDPFVTGTSMPQYQSLEPDPDLFGTTIK